MEISNYKWNQSGIIIKEVINIKELKKGRIYLIKCIYISDKPFLAKFLGRALSNNTSSFQTINCWTGFHHNGKTDEGITGKRGYCVYLQDSSISIIKELSPEEGFLEEL